LYRVSGFDVSDVFIQVRLYMMNIGWFCRSSNQQPSSARVQRIAGGFGVAILLMMTGIAAAQTPAADTPAPGATMSIPGGYAVHESVDVAGRMTDIVGSGEMYDSLTNLQTGPRIATETFEMRALPGNKKPLLDDLRAFASGFGGDPENVAKFDVSKSKYYEFSALFRRNRKYFDYDLLGNPNIPSGQTIPIGPSTARTGSFAWPQVNQSPFMFNTVRRMTDTSLTLFPLSTWTLNLSYSKNLREGPSLTPSGYQFAKYNAIIEQYIRDSTDDITISLDWKPVQGTKLTYEQEWNHYKGDSYFTLNPAALTLQEANGLPVAINDFDSLSPYAVSACNTASMGAGNYTSSTNYTMLTASSNGGPPVINPACAVVSSYMRSQPTRILFPTESLRLQSSSIKNIAMNGDVRFTNANMKLPNYYDSYQGLNGATRELSYLAHATGEREVLLADYGILWQATSQFSLAEQISFSTWHQPGTLEFTSGTTLATPANPNETINYPTLTTTNAATGASTFEGSPAINTPGYGYMGQLYVTNNLTASWDVTPRTTFSLTYRYQDHVVAQGIPHNIPLPVTAITGGTITINENAGILTAAVRPTNNWDLNGSVEVSNDDNAVTSVAPRQLRRYRVHTIYKPRPWATISAVYNDLERHNNTNNNQALVALFKPASLGPPPTAATGTPYEGQLNHVDYSRMVSLAAALYPNEHFGFDLAYTYSDIYSATNECYDNGNQVASTAPGVYPGTASTTSTGAPNVCPNVFTRGATGASEVAQTVLADWFARDFEHAPTQYGSVGLTISPVDKVRYGLGYHISSVNGSTFFNDARGVNGSMVSTWQSPYVNFAYKMRPGLTFKADYNFYGYGEGGPSGPQSCSFSTSPTSTVVPCTSLTAPIQQTGLTISPAGETAPRNFHANNITLGLHYEF
jgi:hypothetical protein